MHSLDNFIADGDRQNQDTGRVKQEEKPQYILLEKTKALYTLLHPLLDLFPNTAKFTLRARMEEALLDAMKFQILQNYRQNDGDRRELMLEVLASLNILSVLLQQAAIFKYVSYGQHEAASGLLKELVAIATARYRNLGGGRL